MVDPQPAGAIFAACRRNLDLPAQPRPAGAPKLGLPAQPLDAFDNFSA